MAIHIHWFRNDLRLRDNPALCHAATGGELLPVFIDDPEDRDEMGAASRVWLHHSLQALNRSLNGQLRFFHGPAGEVLDQLVTDTSARRLTWTRCYTPWRQARDSTIKARLKAQGLEVVSHNGSLLREPWEVHSAQGTPYRVFTPFYRRGYRDGPALRPPLPAPAELSFACSDLARGCDLSELGLCPPQAWANKIMTQWSISQGTHEDTKGAGEAAATARLRDFLAQGLAGYRDGRNYPARAHVSRLSPALHFGELSPHQLWHSAGKEGERQNCTTDSDHFRSELGWREFSAHLLYHNPQIQTENLNTAFDRFPWRDDATALSAWQRGQTGIPIVDAGMRELWHTGYMHNRVRMIVGSFLVKNLLIHWHHGEQWFRDTLVDADHANNAASWQWIAGCGADAAPYFRVFNPVTQGEKFDPTGDYTRRYLPELAALPDRWLFKPWAAPESERQKAGLRLGQDYPAPLVDLAQSRHRALAAWESIRNKNGRPS